MLCNFSTNKFNIHNLPLLTCAFLMLTGCSSSSSDSGTGTVAYNCTQTCLQSSPTLSTNTVSTATGGTVDVTLNFSGNVVDIERVDIFLRDVNSGNNAGTSMTFSPFSSSYTASITVNAGTAAGTYYPYVIIYMTTSNTNNRYYRDSSVSTSVYSFYEIENGSAQPLMITPYSIPYLTVN